MFPTRFGNSAVDPLYFLRLPLHGDQVSVGINESTGR
jgi:hypothetical protein